MFVIVYNGNVILGPMNWNARRFSEVIDEEAGVSIVLDLKNDEEAVVTVNDEIKIYPVTSEPDPDYNKRTQYLHGPFWTFTDTHAVSSMTVEHYPIDAIRNFMKQEVAVARWNKQYANIEVTLDSNVYKFPTDPLTRISFHHYLTSGINKINWKLDQNNWIELTAEHISIIFNRMVDNLQASFEWESTKNAEIESATIETIESVVIEG
jgi:hypothetical protein